MMSKKSKAQCDREWRARVQQVRPEDFQVGSLQSRAAARSLLLQGQNKVRVILFVYDQPLNLETSTCERQIGQTGTLFELVSLDGSHTDLSEAELEEIIQQLPIVHRGCRNMDEQS